MNSLGYYLLMSEDKEEIKENSPVEEEVKTEEATTEEEISKETHVVLSYPERVPNAEKGADHAHAYVMIKVLGILIIFSLVIAKFTSPF